MKFANLVVPLSLGLSLLTAGVVLAQGKDEKSVTNDEESEPEKNGEETPAPGSTRGEFTWSLGGGFVASPRPYIDAKPQVFPIPVLTLRYKRFFFQGIRGGYEWLQTDKLTASVYAQARFRGLEPEESSFLEGMVERRKSMDAGAEVVYRGRPFGFRVSLLSDVLGRSKGQEASFAAITGAPLGKLLVLVGFGPRWLSQNRVDYYYGVREEEARPARPLYKAESTWNLDVSITTIWDPSPKWSFFALVNREGLGSAIKNSPLVERSSAYSLVSSLTYKF